MPIFLFLQLCLKDSLSIIDLRLGAFVYVKGGGSMASKNEDFMGGLFDFDGDGKTDPSEEYLAYEIFEDITGNSSSPQHPQRIRSNAASHENSSLASSSANTRSNFRKTSQAHFEQIETQEHKIKLLKKGAIILAVLMFAGLFYKVIDNRIKDKPYQEALKLFDDGKYQEALIALENMWVDGASDVRPFMNVVHGFKEYEAGNIEEAYRYINMWSEAIRKNKPIRYLPAKYTDMIQDLQEKVKTDYDIRMAEKQKAQAEKDAKERELYQRELAEAKEKLRDRMPYIGMKESYVSYTCLGSYSYYVDSRKNSNRIYVFKDSQGRETYSVTCNNQVVISVWDKLNNRKLTENNTWKKTGSNSTMKSQDDPYNAKDYSNEEDFYDDNWGDFFDYYEAEEYWRDHQ